MKISTNSLIILIIAFSTVAFGDTKPALATKTAKPITIAVIDTGVDIKHEDLKNKIWKNKAEIPGNGIDDDKNGFVDDVYGWNFAENNNLIDDKHAHGTHIAGVISDNAYSVPHQLMILKYFKAGQNAPQQTASLVSSIQYAIKNGADIINISAGGYLFNNEEYQLLKIAKEKGILVIAASGNKKAHLQNKDFYPSAYNLSNVIAVSAVDSNGDVLSTTNLNLSKKNLFYKGDNISGPVPNHMYKQMTGSSQAAAGFTGYISQFLTNSKDAISKINELLNKDSEIVALNTNN